MSLPDLATPEGLAEAHEALARADVLRLAQAVARSWPTHVADQADAASRDALGTMLRHVLGTGPFGPGTTMTLGAGAEAHWLTVRTMALLARAEACAHVRQPQPLVFMPGRDLLSCRPCLARTMHRPDRYPRRCDLCLAEPDGQVFWPSAVHLGMVLLFADCCQDCHRRLRHVAQVA